MTRWNPNAARLQIGQDLTVIEDTYTRLRIEAYHHADDHDIPGGDATVLLGPRADVEAWSYVKLSALMGRLNLGHKEASPHQRRIEAEAIDHDELEPPLAFLAGWVDIIRRDRGQDDTERLATIGGEIRYLRAALDWITATDHDDTKEPWWDQAEQFVDQLHNVRMKLEDVLLEGERDDTGAPCLGEHCDGVRLVKQWAGSQDNPLPERFDTWKCPRCKRRYTADEYSNACKQASRLYADRLTATDMLDVYRVHPSTLRTWVQRGLIRRRGRDDSGRMLYDVDDTLKARDVVETETA
jgi:hypothetical protein